MSNSELQYDREEIYRWILKEDWDSLTKFAHTHAKVFGKDEIPKSAVETFIKQFVTQAKLGNTGPNHARNINHLFVLHKTKLFLIADDDFEVIVVEVLRLNQDDIEQAIYYARLLPNNGLCAQVIARYESHLPKTVGHSQSRVLNVTENRNIADVNYTIPLFKSQQEYEFFQALRQVYPRYDVYPNVALSCIVNFDAVKADLSVDERNFFFTGIVDCVVFDQHRGYKPVFFFELDSVYHDTKEQQAKDGYKDKILSVAGQKLYRIRKVSREIGTDDFVTMINEVVDKTST